MEHSHCDTYSIVWHCINKEIIYDSQIYLILFAERLYNYINVQYEAADTNWSTLI